jgi:hypothetical protein
VPVNRNATVGVPILSEFNLVDLEVSFSYIAEFKKQIYLIRIGSFDVKPFYGK